MNQQQDATTPNEVASLFEAVSTVSANVREFQEKLSGVKTYGRLLNADGRTLLHCACVAGNLEAAQRLVDQCNINDHDEGHWTPLHSAASAGHLNVVRWLLEQPNIQINPQTTTGGTPLHYAASKGHDFIVRMLVAKGADINVTDINGHTPLMKAVCTSREDLVEHLLNIPEISVEVQERETKDNLLHIAVNNKHIDIGALIFKKAPHLAAQVNQDGKAPADLASTAELLRWKELKEGSKL